MATYLLACSLIFFSVICASGNNDDENQDLPSQFDFLSLVKHPLPNGVHESMGLENMPSYEFTSEAKIASPYRLHFPAKFYDNFALLITFNPASDQQNGGYLFSITDAFDTGVDLGLVLEPVENDPRNLAKSRETGDLTYQLAFVRQEDIDTTAGGGFSFEMKNSLVVGQVANKWTQLALKVMDENIVLEVGCPKRTNLISSLRNMRNSRDIRFDEAAKLHIGSGGPILNKNFVVSEEELRRLTKKMSNDPITPIYTRRYDIYKI